jgi:hypothetical protein
MKIPQSGMPQPKKHHLLGKQCISVTTAMKAEREK